MNVKKGCFGYIASRRKRQLVIAALLCAAAVAMFLFGYIRYGSNRNIMSIMAALTCLPAGWAIVNTVMFFRARGCSEESRERIRPHVGELLDAYDLYLTSYSENYPLSHLCICGKTIAAFSEEARMSSASAEKHMKKMMENEGFDGYSLKIYFSIDKYTERLDQMNQLEDQGSVKRMQQLLDLFYSISL